MTGNQNYSAKLFLGEKMYFVLVKMKRNIQQKEQSCWKSKVIEDG